MGLTIAGQTHYRPLETRSVNAGVVCSTKKAGYNILLVCPKYGDYDTVFSFSKSNHCHYQNDKYQKFRNINTK